MKDKLPEKLWDLANLITGFAAAQAMALVFAITNGDFRARLAEVRWLMLPSGLIFNLALLAAVWWCHSTATTTLVADGGKRDSVTRRISLRVTIGRMVAIALFGGVAVSLPFLFDNP